MNPADRLLEIDELDREIVSLSSRINAASYELLVLIREFDERAGWLKWGFEHCADWLHWRCDLSLNAAREKLRVAHALKTLPAVSRAFRDGELSYSKVRALARVARRSNEADLVAFALRTTATRVEDRCRELRCGTAESVFDANRAYASRHLTMRRDPDRGVMTLAVELPLETAKLIDKALDKARDDHRGADFAGEPWAARQADAPGCDGQGIFAGTRRNPGLRVGELPRQRARRAVGAGRWRRPCQSSDRIGPAHRTRRPEGDDSRERQGRTAERRPQEPRRAVAYQACAKGKGRGLRIPGLPQLALRGCPPCPTLVGRR